MKKTEPTGTTPPVWRAENNNEFGGEELNTELTESERKAVSEIENLDIRLHDRSHLILVLLGKKPATEIEMTEDEYKKIKDDLEKLGVYMLKKTEKEESGDDSDFIDFGEEESEKLKLAVSRDKNKAEKLLELDPSEDHEEYGRLMGFPETAIKCFLDSNEKGDYSSRLPKDDYPDWTRDMLFDGFILSKDNWQEEIKTMKNWQQKLKKVSPSLFKERRRQEEKFNKIKDIQYTFQIEDESVGEISVDHIYDIFKNIDQELMESGEWDYDVDEGLSEKEKNLSEEELKAKKLKEVVKKIEKLDFGHFSSEEVDYFKKVLWLWYHHATNKALLSHQDEQKAEEFVEKTIDYQPESSDNEVTKFYSFLVKKGVDKAQEFIDGMDDNTEKETVSIVLENYKELKNK